VFYIKSSPFHGIFLDIVFFKWEPPRFFGGKQLDYAGKEGKQPAPFSRRHEVQKVGGSNMRGP
jgi:hypothetical protein